MRTEDVVLLLFFLGGSALMVIGELLERRVVQRSGPPVVIDLTALPTARMVRRGRN